jgi:hypothetical protein
MNNASLKAFREIAEGNCIYDPTKKQLTIKRGRLEGLYINIEIKSAIELVKAN